MIVTPKDLIRFIDLTNLEHSVSDAQLEDMCTEAKKYGVASVCVQNEYISKCKMLLEDSEVKVTSVFNFPYGDQEFHIIEKEICSAISFGVDEIDVVIPIEVIQKEKDTDKIIEIVSNFVTKIKAVSVEKLTKFIISTDVLFKDELIKAVSEGVIIGGGDFIKTCTGLTGSGINATALLQVLSVINRHEPKIGIKISGGIKEPEILWELFQLIRQTYDVTGISSSNFRIGASSLLRNLAVGKRHNISQPE